MSTTPDNTVSVSPTPTAKNRKKGSTPNGDFSLAEMAVTKEVSSTSLNASPSLLPDMPSFSIPGDTDTSGSAKTSDLVKWIPYGLSASYATICSTVTNSYRDNDSIPHRWVTTLSIISVVFTLFCFFSNTYFNAKGPLAVTFNEKFTVFGFVRFRFAPEVRTPIRVVSTMCRGILSSISFLLFVYQCGQPAIGLKVYDPVAASVANILFNACITVLAGWLHPYTVMVRQQQDTTTKVTAVLSQWKEKAKKT